MMTFHRFTRRHLRLVIAPRRTVTTVVTYSWDIMIRMIKRQCCAMSLRQEKPLTVKGMTPARPSLETNRDVSLISIIIRQGIVILCVHCKDDGKEWNNYGHFCSSRPQKRRRTNKDGLVIYTWPV